MYYLTQKDKCSVLKMSEYNMDYVHVYHYFNFVLFYGNQSSNFKFQFQIEHEF